VKFRSYDSRVLPEMSAKVTFLSKPLDLEAASARSVVTVPTAAIAMRNGKYVVFVVQDGRAVEVSVVTGQQIGVFTEVKEGINAGERVIARVDDQIYQGTKVRVK
jgi:HlyD family secretion protein